MRDIENVVANYEYVRFNSLGLNLFSKINKKIKSNQETYIACKSMDFTMTYTSKPIPPCK